MITILVFWGCKEEPVGGGGNSSATELDGQWDGRDNLDADIL